MRMYEIIQKKRNGLPLLDEEIDFFIRGYTAGDVPDYQAAALTMAIYFNGMNEHETVALTQAMAHSGDTVDLSEFGDLSADKHSTGGVGDKTSLIVAPIVATLGGKVTKMSGRGLGHTGGTVDKLESIPGYDTALSEEAFMRQVREVGLAVIGQSGNLTPADKKLYALRDVTATVDSIPLIVSSIMSKKLAAGSKNIVLDVKVGSGAFMKTHEDAKTLAEEMVRIGKRCGRNIAALLTDMDTPLGSAIGNALEIVEAVNVLRGRVDNDLRRVSLALAAQLVALIFRIPYEEASARATSALESGAAFRKMKEWIAAQGGDASYLDHPERFPRAQYTQSVVSARDGYIAHMDAEQIGIASVILGAGRVKKEDAIDHAAGIVIEKKTGDAVHVGDVLCTLYTNRAETLDDARRKYLSALTFADRQTQRNPLIYEIVG